MMFFYIIYWVPFQSLPKIKKPTMQRALKLTNLYQERVHTPYKASWII